jgi:peptidoglycan hydrolase-like protein with peptidoglycan-binding domain
MATTYPRGVEDRLQWMLDHPPGEAGWCARETWEACGGDHGVPPAWGCADASEVVAKARAAGVLYTGRASIPRGAIVLWEDRHGHMSFANGDDATQTSTDPYDEWGTTGVMPMSWPEDQWGLRWAGWLIRYAGTLLPMTEPGDVHVDRLHLGQEDSDRVRRLQDVLNHTSLPAPGNVDLPPTGLYGSQTDTVVRTWQRVNGHPESDHLTNVQVDELFAGSGHTVIHAQTEPPDPEPEPPEPPEWIEPPVELTFPLGIQYKYSGKPAGEFTFSGSYKELDVADWAPTKDGLTFGMIYANVDVDGEFRTRLTRKPLGSQGADDTAYQTHFGDEGGDNYLLTHVWFESGEANRKLRYSLCTMDGQTATATTRYAKFATIPWEVVVAIAELGVAYMTVVRPALRALAKALGIEWPDLLEQIKAAAAERTGE